jgi:hypothetical protein
MGNMGYPVITRLGISQFWYKNWYTDSNYMFSFKQDSLFQTLLKAYLSYGLTFPSNIFFNPYFYSKLSRRFKEDYFLKNLKFYRRFYFSNVPLGIEHSYFLRYRTGEYFPLRLWMLRYSKWIIIFFNCFKPIKKKSKKKRRIVKEAHAVSSDLRYLSRTTHFNRFKLVYLFLKQNYFKYNSYNF